MLAAGTVIALAAGRYRLRAPLAGSAYGIVWTADAQQRGGAVALKFINADQMQRADAAVRSRWTDSAANEIAFLRALKPWDERHIVRLLDSGVHDGLPVMALELLGSDLGRHTRSERDAGRPIALSTILDWLGQINQALAKVHQYGWRYLDLKPANVLLHLTRARVVLSDFGTIAPLAAGPATAYAGTASWQAPEQFFAGANGYDSDARSDYFSLGALFYYLVTGGLPLRFCSALGQAYREHGAQAAGILTSRHGGALPPTLSADEAQLFAQRVPAPVRDEALALLRALVAASPGERPHSAIAISRSLERIAPAISWSAA